MDINSLLITFFTISFGWLLNELSQFFRYKKDDKELANQALYYLIDLKFILDQLETILLGAKEGGELNPASKRSFNSFIEDEQFNSEEFRKNLKKSVRLISKIDPVLAQELRVFIDGTQMFEADSLKLKTHSHFSDTEMIKMNLKGIKMFSEKIESFIKKIAFRKSKITWLRIHYNSWFKESGSGKESFGTFFQQMNSPEKAT